MRSTDWRRVIAAAMEPATEYLESLPDRRVYRPTTPDEVRAAVGGPLPEHGTPPERVIADLAAATEPFVTAHASGRFYGFVIGGLQPAAYGADLLCSTWNQNAGLYAVAPGAAIVEEVAAAWLLDLLRLPADCSVGFVTGGQMATFTGLAAARDQVLRSVGWDVEADGLQGAPDVHVVVKTERHTTVPRALRFLGLGDSAAVTVASDDQSRIDPAALRARLAALEGPTIICVEAGNLNTGAFDDLAAVADAADEHRGRGHPTWVHVDGAVGLWAAAAAGCAELVAGLDRADSWSTDAHKLLGVPYDSGIAICRHPAAHRAAMSVQAAYLVHSDGAVRDQMDWNPEFSRRSRGLAVYAALRALGREGVAALVERVRALAQRFADELAASGQAAIVNDVVFNQVLVRWHPPGGEGDPDSFTDEVIARIQADGTAFFSGTTWGGMRLMRISVADWATDESDVDRAVTALLRCARGG